MSIAFIDTLHGLEQTYARIKPHIDPRTGIIPWVKEIPTAYAGHAFHIYMAKHPVLGKIDSLKALLANIKASSSAMGYTKRQAKTLAVCEALERWSCMSQGNEYAERHTQNQLEDRAIPPDVLHGISALQYQHRKENNGVHTTGSGFIPEMLPPDREVLWCPVFDLADASWKYVLKSSCYYGHHDDGRVYSTADSRGVAAGPDREFCLWNALLELIETDAAAIWNANALLRPEVDMQSFANPLLSRLYRVHHDLGRTLTVLDVTMDIEGVCVFAALSHDPAAGNTIKGFGAHPEAEKALEKALKECCQMLPNVMQCDEQGNYTPKNVAQQAHFQHAAHFQPASGEKLLARDYAGKKQLTTLQEIIDALLTKNIMPLMLEHTRPELDLHVVRVFGVGMRPWFNRRGPGRLYDVPVSLGLRTNSITEDQVFPVPVE